MQKIIRKRDKKTFFSFLRLLLYVKKTSTLFFYLERTSFLMNEIYASLKKRSVIASKQASQLRLHQLKALIHRRL
jgi:hypothetical protein